jgi:hypothetical protein
MNDSPSSLGFNNNIVVVSSIPQITKIVTPNVSGVYTTGDMLHIHVVYDLPIKVYDGQNMSIQLETGHYDRWATFVGISDNNHAILVFEYIVSEPDESDDLDLVPQQNQLGLW